MRPDPYPAGPRPAPAPCYRCQYNLQTMLELLERFGGDGSRAIERTCDGCDGVLRATVTTPQTPIRPSEEED